MIFTEGYQRFKTVEISVQSYRLQGSMTRENNSKPQDRSKDRKCYNCGSNEHLKRNCLMPPKESSENWQKMLDSSKASRNEGLHECRDNPTDGQFSRTVRSLNESGLSRSARHEPHHIIRSLMVWWSVLTNVSHYTKCIRE